MMPKNRMISLMAFFFAFCLAGAAEAASGVSVDKERVAKELALWFKTPDKGLFDDDRAKIKELLDKKILIRYEDFDSLGKVRLGWFVGGRTELFYRAYRNNDFAAQGADAVLYSRVSDHPELFVIPRDGVRFRQMEKALPFSAKMTGTDIVGEILKGRLDGGTIGEGAFIAALHKGAPLVAVAMLGYDATPGKAIILRRGVTIKSPEDFKNKVFTCKESGDGDPVFLKAFFRKEGVDPKDVIIVPQLPYNKIVEAFRQKKVDGGFFHLVMIKELMSHDLAYIYRKMDWVEPELSHALLVFRRDFFDKNRDKAEGIMRAYMKRVSMDGENALSKNDPGVELKYPAFSKLPLVNIAYLEKMQALMLENGAIGKKSELKRFVDNDIVRKIAGEMGR